MAQYPNAVPSFATIQDGVNFPQAADINDRQIEIVAIADGLKNGLAHPVTLTSTNKLIVGGELSAGASTLASLQVTGNSTFSGTVNFAGAITGSLTLSSGATVSTGIIRQNSLPMWLLRHSTHVLIASNSSAGVPFDTEDVLRGDIGHSTSANSSRVTLNTTGIYSVSASAKVTSTNNPVVKLHIRLNDTTDIVSATLTPFALPFQNSIRITQDIRMASSGYLTCVYVSSGGHPSTVGSSTPSHALRFSGHFIG